MSDPVEQFDAVIIGGGVIGCSIAWRLRQAGMRAAVLERGEIGCEASQAAGGMLVPLAEADREDDFFHLAVASRAMYREFSDELKLASGIDVEYRADGTLYLVLTDEDEEELDRRWHWQREAGLNVKRLNAGCALKIEPLANPALRWALKYPDDHQVNNRRMMLALPAAARNSGARIFTHIEAQQLLVETEAGRRRIAGVTTDRGEFRAPAIVIAAGSWSSRFAADDGRPVVNFEIAPVRGQMVAVEMPVPPVNHNVYSRRGYLIPRLGGTLIAGSTTERCGYDKRVTAGGIASIVERAAEILPGFNQLSIVETWAGLRPHSPDDLPVLGEDPDVAGLIYATGHYRNGILLAPITAQAISELIVRGESSIDIAPFSATRFAFRQAAG
jgi:glycine oxidase